MRAYVYGLCDPDTGELRYVGKSRHPVNRLTVHMHHCDTGRSYCKNWLRSLKQAGKRPQLNVLLDVEESEVYFWEQDLISFFRQEGFRLTNDIDAGPGCPNPSPETRQKMSRAQRGKRMPEEVRDKISRTMKGRKKSLETRARMSAAAFKREVKL